MGHLSVISATQCGRWADRSDDRWCADPSRGLFYVCDASGPTYGGYYAPFGVDPGLATFEAVFRCEEGDVPSRLHKAVMAAHEHMRALWMAFEQTFARIRKTESDGLTASRQAADAVRPAAWEHLRGRSFAHFAASLTACCIERDRLSLIQVGSGRAYRFREGAVELLALDHTLLTVLCAAGRAEEATASPHFRGVTVSMLGMSDDLLMNEAACDVRPGDRILLCSGGVWARDGGSDAVPAALAASTQEELAEVVKAAAGRCDATALVVSIRGSGS